MATVYLSLGSNLGDRLGSLRRACRALEKADVRLDHFSSVYETEPLDFAGQNWFLNCVIEADTSLPPLNLLREAQRIEEELGRRRETPKGPRTIDVDILLYGDLVLASETLTLPHPRMTERKFVLEPLREIAPALRLPPTFKTVEQFYGELCDSSQVRFFCPPLTFE
ncbi:MAG: 2-amino-4-hydroxy-6-hydroxymethyldihydropteridine diphosphokinase [Acidobacteria bacterium]|nr:2-amino-4-hydroxy-6-hydroxymethyldihydropteridine diphosphokinase [Acidobacteriota bacterium]